MVFHSSIGNVAVSMTYPLLLSIYHLENRGHVGLSVGFPDGICFLAHPSLRWHSADYLLQNNLESQQRVTPFLNIVLRKV